MPTVITRTIAATSSPTTPDYTTLQAWEDAITADLVAADEQWVGECLNQGEFTGTTTLLTVDGHTTDATRNIILGCATGASFNENASVRTNALAYNSSNGVAITSSVSYGIVLYSNDDYVTFRDLQIRSTGTEPTTLRMDGTSNTVDSCVVATTGTATNPVVRFPGAAGKIVNSVVYTGSATSLVFSANYTTQCAVYGCTLIKTGSAGGTGLNFTTGASNGIVKNTAILNVSTVSTGTFSASSGYNGTTGASAPGSNNTTSLTFADQIENTSSDFRAKSTGGLQAGTPDSTNTPVDITGLTRSATTPWIGCWEVASAPAGGPPPVGAWSRQSSRIIGGGVYV